MEDIEYNKPIWISLAAITGLIIFSWVASYIYYFLAGYIGNPMPWTIWQALLDPLSDKSGGKMIIALGLPFVGMFAGSMKIFELFNDNRFDYADAKWADLAELKSFNLLGDRGVLLGKLKGQYIFSPEDTHTIVSARSRSGKGVGVIVPNLLLWNGSAVCLDIKHENYKLTAGYRAAYSSDRVFKWDPLADGMKSHGFNPLDQISKDPMDRIVDIRRIAGLLMPIDGKDKFWITEARSLFVGLALYVLDQPDEIMPSTIGSIYRLLSAEEELGDICRLMVKNHPELDQTIIATMNRFANKAAKERSGVKSQLDSALEPWKYPKVDAATTKSSFQLGDLRKEKMSIYICVKPGHLEMMSGLIRLFFEFLVTNLTLDLPDTKKEPHEILVVLDEMHMLGKMETVTKTFTLTAGYRCRVLAAIQDFSVLDDVYGKAGRKMIFGNCDNQIYFRPKLMDTAREISDMLGNRIVEVISYSQKMSFSYEPKIKNTSYQEKPLMSPAKVFRLSNKKGIVISANEHPIYINKVHFAYDKNFKNRIMTPPAVPPLTYRAIKIPKFDCQELKEIASKPELHQTSIFDKPDLQENDDQFETRINKEHEEELKKTETKLDLKL